MKTVKDFLKEETHPHVVHVRDYSNGSEIDATSKSWGSKEFNSAVKTHSATHAYSTDKGEAFKFKHAHQAIGFRDSVNKHHKDLDASICEG